MKNSFKGPSLNDCMASCPNSLNNMIKVLLRFRTFEKAVQYDLSKAYKEKAIIRLLLRSLAMC